MDLILRFQNIDEAFNDIPPEAESHAAYVFTNIEELNMPGYENLIDKDKLFLWLFRRQNLTEGFNG